MIGLSALVATWTLGAALHTAPLSLRDDLSPRAEGMTSLRVDGFGADRPRPSPSLLAQPAEPPASPPTEAPAETTGGGGAEACDLDRETSAGGRRLTARYVLRRRIDPPRLRVHRAFAAIAA